MYINLLRYSKVPNKVLARQLNRSYCCLTYDLNKFVLCVFAYNINIITGYLEDLIEEDIVITEDYAYQLLAKYNAK